MGNFLENDFLTPPSPPPSSINFVHCYYWHGAPAPGPLACPIRSPQPNNYAESMYKIDRRGKGLMGRGPPSLS